MIQNPKTREKGYRFLIEMYQKRVYGVIRKMVLIHEDADDITQNTFIKAFKNINNFHGNSSLFTWLYRIATNESLNFLQKKKKRFFFSVDDHESAMESYLDHSSMITGDDLAKILDDHKVTQQQFASRLGVSQAYVSMMVHGRTQIRTHMARAIEHLIKEMSDEKN